MISHNDSILKLSLRYTTIGNFVSDFYQMTFNCYVVFNFGWGGISDAISCTNINFPKLY